MNEKRRFADSAEHEGVRKSESQIQPLMANDLMTDQ
jgi:hypothetical protein